MSLTRTSIKFTGESGQGINTIGKLLSKALTNTSLYTFGYREYPSLIRGGVASFQIDFSNKKINSSSRYCNILLSFTQESFDENLKTVSNNSLLIYDFEDLSISTKQKVFIKEKNIKLMNIDSNKIAIDLGGTELMSNVVMLGFVWKILNLNSEILIDTVLEYFKDKNIDTEMERRCILGGYNSPTFRPELSLEKTVPNKALFSKTPLTISGNEAISLGAVASGVRAYYAYPMTPATSIFKFLGNTSKETGILVKQAENEITAIQMALGSMHMGTRALTATSGGGFDLMIETISCAGMSETPLVVVLSQRAGASTGVPTWTGTGDINTAVRGGHGDFPRCVISVSDAESSYTLIQEALNIAEIYQIPVILLTEKQISEAIFTIDKLPKDIPIRRDLKTGEYRYEITESGISPRWIPSKDKKPYLSTSDEHTQNGISTEDREEILAMSNKRMYKLETLRKNIPEPKLYGSENAECIFVGYGSTKNTLLDIMQIEKDISYLHFEYIYPLRTKILERLIEKEKNLILVEENQTGQFGKIIKEETGYEFKEKILKYDSRPLFIEDILEYINNK